MYYITLYNYSQRFFPPGSVFRGAYLEPGHPGSSFKDGKKHQKLWAKQICGGFQQDLIDMNLICVEKSCWEGAKMATKKTGHQCFRLFW